MCWLVWMRVEAGLVGGRTGGRGWVVEGVLRWRLGRGRRCDCAHEGSEREVGGRAHIGTSLSGSSKETERATDQDDDLTQRWNRMSEGDQR